jgi:hypothetical protein
MRQDFAAFNKETRMAPWILDRKIYSNFLRSYVLFYNKLNSQSIHSLIENRLSSFICLINAFNVSVYSITDTFSDTFLIRFTE